MNRIAAPTYVPNPIKGTPVSNGKAYIGIVDLDPTIEANQKSVFALQESGLLIEIPQPVDTSAGGIFVYDNSPVSLYVTGDYSLKVLDGLDAQIYYIPKINVDGSGEIRNFETLTEMLASSLNVGNTYATQGQLAANDGGGGTYYISATGTADGYVNHTVNTADVAILQFDGPLPLLAAGAGAGLDDTAAVTAANTVSNHLLFAAEKEFLLVNYEPLDGTTLECAGATISRYSDTLFSTTTTSATIVLTNDDVTINGGIHSTGAAASTTAAWSGSIVVNGGNNILINGCKFINQWGAVFGHETQNGVLVSNGVTISNCHFDGCSHNTYLADIDGFIFTSNISENSLRDGLRTVRNTKDITIDGNIIRNNGDGTVGQSQDGIDLFIAGNTLSITNNIIHTNQSKGIDIKKGDAGELETLQNEKIIIAGNHIYSNVGSGVETGQSQAPVAYVKNISVTDNHIYLNGQFGVFLDYSEKAIVSDNQIYINGFDGIDIRNSFDWVVIGNIVYGNGTDINLGEQNGINIELLNGPDGLVTGNIVKPEGIAQVNGIICASGACYNNIVTGHYSDIITVDDSIVTGKPLTAKIQNLDAAIQPVANVLSNGSIAGVTVVLDTTAILNFVIRVYSDTSTYETIVTNIAVQCYANQAFTLTGIEGAREAKMGDVITVQVFTVLTPFTNAIVTINYVD